MKINVAHVAKLANLPITSEEEKKFETQLSETLEYVKQLEEIDTTGIKPTNQVTGLENLMRDDVTKPSLSQEEALKNSTSTYNGFFKVPAVLSE